MLLGQEKRLASYYPCDVGISIYSPIPEVHDTITRRPGSFDRSIRVIENLYNLAIPIEIKCCVMRNNVTSYLGVADIAKQYGALLQIECAIFDSADGDICTSQYLRLLPEQLEIVLRDKNNPLYIGPELENYGEEKQEMHENSCRAGIQMFCITPDGILTPCCSFHASLGSLKEQHLPELLTNNNQSLTWWTTLTLEDYEECGRHDYCGYCKLCPGLNFSEHGTPLKAGENNCYIAKIRYNLALKIQRGEDPLKGRSIDDTISTLSGHTNEILKRVYTKSHYNQKLYKGKDASL